MTRRTAIAFVGTIAAYLHGKPVRAEQGQGMQLVLDGVAEVTVIYRGRRVSVSPAEILDALQAGTSSFPNQSYRK